METPKNQLKESAMKKFRFLQALDVREELVTASKNGDERVTDEKIMEAEMLIEATVVGLLPGLSDYQKTNLVLAIMVQE